MAYRGRMRRVYGLQSMRAARVQGAASRPLPSAASTLSSSTLPLILSAPRPAFPPPHRLPPSRSFDIKPSTLDPRPQILDLRS
eukprot:1885303-Rhodomonas_salina.2